jgi:hypothetical protein
MVKSSQTKSLTFKGLVRGLARKSADPPDVPDSQGFQAFCDAKSQTISALPQGLVNHVSQGLVNHAGKCGAGDLGLTSLFKPKRKRLG